MMEHGCSDGPCVTCPEGGAPEGILGHKPPCHGIGQPKAPGACRVYTPGATANTNPEFPECLKY